MQPRSLIAPLALAIGTLVGWLLMTTPEEQREKKASVAKKPLLSQAPADDPESNRKLRESAEDRETSFDPNAIPYERVIAFKSDEDYRAFLDRLARSKARKLGQLDQLRAVRIGFDTLADLDTFGLDPDDLQYNFPVNIPERAEIEPQPGAVGFGASALEFLGITADNSEWGRGVKVAVIDTGIVPHLALSENIQHINLVELTNDLEPHSHGTSVASLIAGQHPNMRGVAPAAELISVRVANESGSSNSFLLAQGIIAAVDAGAQLINISMGSNGDSLLVRDAVDYASARGAVIFASSGNEGMSQAVFPAAHPDVFAVGAVDAVGTHLNFSNQDADLAFTAPGLDVRAAFPGDNVTSFTGTSGATPFPVGAAAALMSESDSPLSAKQAVDLLLGHSNEAGAPGADPLFGEGILNVGRAMNRDTPGIEDVAVASHHYVFPTEDSSFTALQVNVENRGTETVTQATVLVNIGNDRFPLTVQSLRPNERKVLTVPSGLSELRRDGEIPVVSEISLPDGQRDAQPANDLRHDLIIYPAERDDR